MLDGELDQTGEIVDVQFMENAAAVGLNGFY
jgi:hypothetical protein